ncbi:MULTISPECIES: hypothetical protein [Herbaspirillum]|uniref:TolA-binding protein n=1 Tax=Herbaspirillum frisingense TaxID=92645 RepID=A0ABU1PAY1_9BURK|nr:MULTISPECIES: hypothetical protein [Herbaspirillum]MDR6582900.1 TolA-binding protein [Herbaspirillum frisingense]
MIELFGWNHPALTRHDLARAASGLSERIRATASDTVPESLEKALARLPTQLALLQGQTVQYLFNGNGLQAAPAYMTTLSNIEAQVTSAIGWEKVDNNLMPTKLARRLRSINAQVEQLTPDKDALANQINLIREAVEAAETLPSDLESLNSARAEVSRISDESATLLGKIQTRSEEANAASAELSAKQDEASRLVAQCEEAYRITTTKGLAAAFDQRASKLSFSMWVWVFGLLVGLSIGAYLGIGRVTLLSTAMSSDNPQWNVIWMHIVLSLLSIGPPLWFSWLATKQIGQRFRLAEDYAFKASVAKAYEGYRREAARIDEAFEARLFGSALTRLEEAPLRLVESDTHGSPWHELISSSAFQKALGSVPELKNKFVEIAKAGLPKNGKNNPSKTHEQKTEQEG